MKLPNLLPASALAMLIMIGGWLGQMLSVPPGYASPLWPPAGIALAALLIWGRQLWPGVWIGSLLLNLWIGSSDGNIGTAVVVSAMGIATGSTLQALAALWLSRRRFGSGVPRLDNPREIFTFIALAGPLACLIAPSAGVGSLIGLGIIPMQTAMFSWWNWWIGDSLGTVILLPLIFCLFAQPRDLWASRRLSVMLPLGATLLALAISFILVKRAENTRIQLEFNIRAATIEKTLSDHIDRLLSGSLVVHDLFRASKEVERKDFSIIAKNVMERYPEIQVLEWLPRVTHDQLQAFEQAVQKEGYKNFRVTERSADGSLVPVSGRDEYFPVLYLQPFAGNEKAFGLDSASNPLSRKSKELARTTGKPTVSQRLKLIQETGDYYAVLVSIPVFESAEAPDPAKLRGFVTGLVRPGHLVENAIKDLELDGLHFMLRDLSAPPEESELFADASSGTVASDPALQPWIKNFTLADHTWQILVMPDRYFGVRHGSSLPWITLIGGLFFTTLLGAYLLSITGSDAQIRKLVEARTHELNEATEALTESENNLRQAQQIARIGSWALNIPNNSLTWSEQSYEIFGIPRITTASYRLFLNTVHPEDREIVDQAWRLALTGKPYRVDHRILVDGNTKWVREQAELTFDEAGRLLSGVGTVQDITEQKNAEFKIRQLADDMEATLEAIPDLLFELDINGRYIAVKARSENQLAAPLEQLAGLNVSDVLLPESARTVLDALAAARATGGDYGRVIKVVIDGKESWFELSVARKGQSDDGSNTFIMLSRDVSKRKRDEDKLRLSARVFADTHEGISITDADGIIIDVNPSFSKITGYSRDEAIGNKHSILKSNRQASEFYDAMWKALTDEGHWQGEIWNRKKNGIVYAELLTISALRNDQGETVNYVGLFSDITQIKQQQQTLELMAHYDALTQLPNRVLFADRFHQAIARARRDKLQLAVCYIDLDGFKQVNDMLGHAAGDLLLIEVANRIKRSLREDDTVSRLGGDEFALLLGDITSLEQCELTLERIHQSIAEAYSIDGNMVNIAASSGVTMYPQDDSDPDTLLRHADQAMYQAKLQGRNRYFFFDPAQDQQAQLHRNQLHVIEDAFKRREFCLYYQPKVNMKTGEVFGAEALIRWNHPERGLVPPHEFLPAISGTHLESPLGSWVIEEALKQLEQWQNQGLNLQVSINISPRHLQSPDFYAELDAALARHPAVYSRKLELEVLESSAMDNLAEVSRVIDECFNLLGVPFALDDFGTGYSSLTHMRHLQAATVKIDQSFVRDMVDDPDDFAIVEGIIGLSKAFRREVIAEGVETAAHGLILISMDCHLGQGYAIARPMQADVLPQWMQTWKPFKEWQKSLDKMGDEKAQFLILRMELDQWFTRMEESLLAEDTAEHHWPVHNGKKCHLGRWIIRAKRDGKINQDRLANLEKTHEELHRIAGDLRNLYQEGKLEEARTGIKRLRATYHVVGAILGQLSS